MTAYDSNVTAAAGIKVQTTNDPQTNGSFTIDIVVQKLTGGGEAFTGNVTAYFDPNRLTVSGVKDSGVVNGGTITWTGFSVPATGHTFTFSATKASGSSYGIVHADAVDTGSTAWNHDPTKF